MTIVVGYDGHESAAAVLDEAIELATARGTGLVVVTVAEVALAPVQASTDEFLDGTPVEAELDAPADVEEALARARAAVEARGLEADYVWASGEPSSVLVDVAEDRGAELIVVGGHEQSLFGRLLDPNVVTELERAAPCEVRVVGA